MTVSMIRSMIRTLSYRALLVVGTTCTRSLGWKEDSKSSISNVSSLGIKDQGSWIRCTRISLSYILANQPSPTFFLFFLRFPPLSCPHPVLATPCYNPSVSRGWRVSCARLISSIIAHPLYILHPFLKHRHDGSTSTFYRITGNRRYGVQLGEVKNEKPVIRDGISWEDVVRGNIKISINNFSKR